MARIVILETPKRFVGKPTTKKEPGIFQPQFFAEGIYFVFVLDTRPEKKPKEFQPQSWADPPPHFDEPCTLSLSTQGGSRTPPKVEDGEYQYMVKMNVCVYTCLVLNLSGPIDLLEENSKNLRQVKPWKLEKGGVVAAKQIQNAHWIASHIIFQRKDSIPFPTTPNSKYHRLIMKTFLWHSRIYKTGFL